MKKLTLAPGDLRLPAATWSQIALKSDQRRVESLSMQPADARDGRGTVQGNEWVLTPRCVQTQAADTCWCTESGCP